LLTEGGDPSVQLQEARFSSIVPSANFGITDFSEVRQ
jgi:hypothetical protein